MNNSPESSKSSSEQAPICILGMHRSGTSMITGLLSACGLWLGPEERLMPPHPDNPDGYFENLDLVDINEALLKYLNGSWHTPPKPSEGWLHTQTVTELAATARTQLHNIAQSAAGRPWGWKDPRTCITLPFWQLLLPEMKTIVCLRNPVEVSRSLHRRDGFSLCRGLQLWQTYNRQIMGNLTPGSFIVTHYDTWFNEPEKELRRLFDFIDWPVSDDKIIEASQRVRKEHRRYKGSNLASLKTLGGPEPARLYNTMRDQAGPYYSSANEEAVSTGENLPIDALEWAAICAKAEQADKLNDQLKKEYQKNTDLTRKLNKILNLRAFYRLGDIIDFGRGGNAPLYTREGWDPPGPVATRFSSTVAQIVMRLTEPVSQLIKLSVHLRTVLPTEQQSVTIELRTNGQPLTNWIPRGVKWDIYETVIPVDSTLSELRLEFCMHNTGLTDKVARSEVREKQGMLFREMKLLAID